MRELHTVAEAVDLLGGNRAVAELTGRKNDSAVSNWKERGSFPTNTYTILKPALEAHNATAPDSLWGMAQAEQAAE
jgi:hypothetical protein